MLVASWHGDMACCGHVGYSYVVVVINIISLPYLSKCIVMRYNINNNILSRCVGELHFVQYNQQSFP